MTMWQHVDAAVRGHRKLGAWSFAGSFVAILASFTMVLPNLSLDKEAALARLLQEYVSPSLRAVFLTSPAPPARAGEAPPVATAASAPRPATVALPKVVSQRSNLNADISQLSRFDEQISELKKHETKLDEEVQIASTEQELSRRRLAAPSATAPAAEPQPTPEEAALRGKVEQAKAKLAALKVYDTDQHPDVVVAEEELLTLENRMQQLRIERWGKPEEAADERIVESDKRVLEALVASKAVIEQQIDEVQRDRDALWAKAHPRRVSAVSSTPGEPALGELSVPPTNIARPDTSAASGAAAQKLTWAGGLVVGVPFSFMAAILIALGSMLIAEYSAVRFRGIAAVTRT